MYELVAFSPEAGLMSVFVGGHAYLLDKDDLAIVGPCFCACWPTGITLHRP